MSVFTQMEVIFLKNTKNIVLFSLLGVIIAMSVGYAALAQQLAINGTTNISASWDVKITDIKANSLVGATVSDGFPTYTATNASFDVSLAYPGASASFDITIANNGTIDAILESITGLSETNSGEPSYLTYTLSGITTGETLTAGASNSTATISVTWDKSSTSVPEGKVSKTASINLNYVQAY